MSQVRNILLADDDPNDVHIVKAAFTRAGYDFPFHVVPNGEQAIAYLKGEGKYANRKKSPMPSLLLLDIKMPSIDGFEVLRWIRSRPEWRVLPVIVLTNSYYGPDVNHAYDLGANSFLTKPGDFDQYVCAVKQVAHFWLVQNLVPEVGPFLDLSAPPAKPTDPPQPTAPAIEPSIRLAAMLDQRPAPLAPPDPQPGHN
jgi:CheY-like chemotaxis protein